MAELAHFKNFAKLKDTSVEFNDITVLAGKPGTGKSYVMKMMYAIDECFNLYSKSKKNILKLMEKFIENKDKRSKEESEKEFLMILKRLEKIDAELPNEIRLNINNLLNSIFTNLNQISNNFFINSSLIKIQYKNEKFEIGLHEKPKKNIGHNIIFVETPLILEFHKHLDKRKAKTPYHIESLINILDEDYSFTDEEQDEFIKTFSKKANDIIGGDIKNRNGSFVYSRNDDKDYNIFNASSGIKSIGLLQYLVTNKALKKGSVLFWEEPEVHLHPEWQKKMIELFLELMNAGIKIVFSTHSPYMCEYLNALSQNKNLSDRVSFNLLQDNNGVVENTVLKDSENWDLIQSELLDPLEEIAWQYL